MLLEELAKYAQLDHESDSIPAFYAVRRVNYMIELDRMGCLLFPTMTDMGQIPGADNRWGLSRPVPQVQRTLGIRPLLLADKADYTLGYSQEERTKERAWQRHQAYVELVERCAYETEERDVNAILRFLRSNPLQQVLLDESFNPSGIITFIVEGRATVDNPEVQRFWAEVNRSSKGPTMQCLVCGNLGQVMSRSPYKVKGLAGGHQSGTSLISASAGAFQSHGLHASMNSPTCSACGDAFTQGINRLLSSRRHCTRVGACTILIWSDGQPEFDVLRLLAAPDPSQVQMLIQSVHESHCNGSDGEPLHAVALSASGSRVVVRDWISTTMREARVHLAKWFNRQEITRWSDIDPPYYNLRDMAKATERNIDSLPVSTPVALLRNALTGTPLPMSVLFKAIRRVGVDKNSNHSRASLIKLVLMSQHWKLPEGYMGQLEGGSTDCAYLCGRLLAVLEKAQREALPGLSTTVVDRFYGAASSAPRPAFRTLLERARFQLSALRRSNPRGANALKAQIEDIVSGIVTFPKTLALGQQAFFALGYYHERARDGMRAREAARKKRPLNDTAVL